MQLIRIVARNSRRSPASINLLFPFKRLEDCPQVYVNLGLEIEVLRDMHPIDADLGQLNHRPLSAHPEIR